MPYCSSCGFQVEDIDNFCARCGTDIKYRGKTNDNFPVAKKKTADDSFWKVFSQSIRHAFFDNDQKLSRNRKIINIFILIGIAIVGLSIVTPYLDTVKINIGGSNEVTDTGECRFRLDARNIDISDVNYFPDKLAMEMLVTNNKDEDVMIEKLAKTYEFRFDNKGDTENEHLSMNVPAGKTLKLAFSVKKEPYILGLEFADCEKIKVSKWETIY